ncbi:hypothetical protein ABZ281_22505 [Streptomyces sp. NPDC006265]|uniref:hypothetical protein n=1 Tax=Streptomyces sp. NPDC006265 TaxID=3156740 RepID=UPI0033A187F4
MNKPIESFDRWHKRYSKPERGDASCQCGTPQRPLYPSADHGRGHRWQARYTGCSGKEKRPAFATWQEARNFLDKVLVESERQTSRDNSPGSLPVEYFAAEMTEIPNRLRRPSHPGRQLTAYKNWISRLLDTPPRRCP